MEIVYATKSSRYYYNMVVLVQWGIADYISLNHTPRYRCTGNKIVGSLTDIKIVRYIHLFEFHDTHDII